MRIIIKVFGSILILSSILFGITTYALHSFDSETGIETHDIWGRPLTETPTIMKIPFGEDHMWAGWGWFFVDMVIFWGSLFLGGFLLLIAMSTKRERGA